MHIYTYIAYIHIYANLHKSTLEGMKRLLRDAGKIPGYLFKRRWLVFPSPKRHIDSDKNTLLARGRNCIFISQDLYTA